MVSIYYLYDPVNKAPFYVGYTKNMKTRLYAHMNDGQKWCWRDTEHKYRKTILTRMRKLEGIKIEIIEIEKVPKELAKERERFHYDTMISEGYKLYNDPRSFKNNRKNYADS